jgi:acetyl esterase/lipase
MRLKTLYSVVLVVAAAVLCATSADAAPGARPGQVLSVTPLPAAVTLPGSVDAKRIVYGTTGVAGRPALSSGAIYFPPGRPPAGGWPVVAWAHGTTGLADKCAYSIGGPVEPDRDWAYLGAWLGQGYAIVASDYVGLGTPGNHPYLNGIVEAHSVVDAVKAATRAFPGTLSRRWVVIGQSQGGGAAVITARHATEFGGPELDYRGAVATGVPAHIEDIFLAAGPHVPPVQLTPNTTVYGLYLLSGLRTSFPELNIDSYLTPLGRHWVDYAENYCDPELVPLFRAHPLALGDVLAKPLADLPDARALLHGYLGIPESGYDRPLFIGQGLTDTDVFMPGTLATAAAMTANGQPLTFRVYPTDHNGTVNASLPDSIPFVRRLFS